MGRDRLLDQGHADTRFVIADAEKLPIQPGTVDGITMAFGLRNVTDKPAALAEMTHALKPGARLVVLEFSKVTSKVAEPAYALFQSLWPKVGQWVTGDGSPYQYLVESIDMHPDQETLADMMRDAGLAHVGFHNLLGCRSDSLAKLRYIKLSQHLNLLPITTLNASSERLRFT